MNKNSNCLLYFLLCAAVITISYINYWSVFIAKSALHESLVCRVWIVMGHLLFSLNHILHYEWDKFSHLLVFTFLRQDVLLTILTMGIIQNHKTSPSFCPLPVLRQTLAVGCVRWISHAAGLVSTSLPQNVSCHSSLILSHLYAVPVSFIANGAHQVVITFNTCNLEWQLSEQCAMYIVFSSTWLKNFTRIQHNHQYNSCEVYLQTFY